MEPKAPLADCSNCPLAEQPHVPGFGPDKPKIILIGEAPGANEAELGRPFIGKSGQLIRQVLSHYDVNEDDVYFTNACLCRPENNKTPNTKAMKACRKRLVQEVQERCADGTIIVAVGAIAAKSILDSKDSITKLRLQGITESPEFDAPIIASYHPAAALRNPDLLPSIFHDLEAITNPARIQWEPTKYSVVTDANQAVRALNELCNYEQVAIDVEVCSTDGKSHGRVQDFRWLCIGVSHRPGASVVFDEGVLRDTRVVQAFSEMLRQTKGVYHNGKFDIQYLRRIGPAHVNEDTMLLHYSCDERRGTHDLEQVSVNTLHSPRFKTEAKGELMEDERSLAYLPKEILWKYNAYDVDHTHRLVEPLTERMRREGTERPYRELLVPASNVLAEIELRGILTDEGRLDALSDEFTHALEQMEEVFVKRGVNPRSAPQVKAELARLGFDVPNTAKDTIKDLDEEFVHDLLRYKERHKMQSTYIKGLRKHIVAGRVHPSYKLHGTETGRLSSGKPNIQNQPREHGIRDVFVAGEGNVLINADYSGIELRLAGIFAKDEYLCQAFREGRSPHKELAANLYGPNYTSEQYAYTKTVNFGTLYRETAFHLAHRLRISQLKAQQMIDGFYRQSPKIRTYQSDILKQIKREGHLWSHFGRKRRFWLLTDDNIKDVWKEACNFPLQSAASDFTLSALIAMHEPLKKLDAHPIITVHDSIVVECPEQAAEQVCELMNSHMFQMVNDVPLEVEFKIGKAWGQVG